MTENKTLCTGCGACVKVCGFNAISLQIDNEGFTYPIIDQDKCVSCGKCNESCEIPDIHVAEYGVGFRINDSDTISKSASGGAFAAIAKVFWDKHPEGIVFGAAINDKMEICHKGVDKNKGLDELYSSKYVQSNLGDSFEEIGKLLSNNINVLFSGTPCQCSALRKIFGYDEKLLIVDLVCNGVASPLAFNKYIERLEKTQGSKVNKYLFRNKKYYYGRGMYCSFDDGVVIERNFEEDIFCRLYMCNLISRPSCYNCKFTTPNRNSDITIGDFHGLENIDPDFYENGTSLVIPHTGKGTEYEVGISVLGVNKRYPISQCMQPRLESPAKYIIIRKMILNDYINLPTEIFYKKYGKFFEK